MRNIHVNELRAIRAMRLMKGLSRDEAGKICGTSGNALEQLENGRVSYTKGRLERIIFGLGYTMAEFREFCKNPPDVYKKSRGRVYRKTVFCNRDRRSYKRNLTDSCKAIKALRLQKGLTQYQASAICGYSKASFGHIENGRIELSDDRIEYIITKIGATTKEYEELVKTSFDREVIIEKLISNIRKMKLKKLEAVYTMMNLTE